MYIANTIPYSGLSSRGEIFVDWIVKTFHGYTVWRENFTVVKFYGSPLNCLDEKLLGF